jgi:hypothetical protein
LIPADIAAELDTAAQNVATAANELVRARNRLDAAIYNAVSRRGVLPSAVAEVAGVPLDIVESYPRPDEVGFPVDRLSELTGAERPRRPTAWMRPS